VIEIIGEMKAIEKMEEIKWKEEKKVRRSCRGDVAPDPGGNRTLLSPLREIAPQGEINPATRLTGASSGRYPTPPGLRHPGLRARSLGASLSPPPPFFFFNWELEFF